MIVQQPITAEQKATLKALAKQCKLKVSFGNPRGPARITLSGERFAGNYPRTIDGYTAALATLEQMQPARKEETE